MATEHGGCPVVGFDHNSAEHSADPVAVYRHAARPRRRSAWTEAHGGYCVVYRLQQRLRRGAGPTDVFSSARNEYGGEGLATVIPKVAGAPAHPGRARPAGAAVVPQDHQPADLAGGDRADEADDRALHDVVHRPGHRGRASATSRRVIGVPAVVTLDWLGMDRRRLAPLRRRPARRAGQPARQPGARARRRGGHPLDGAHRSPRPSPSAARTRARTSSRWILEAEVDGRADHRRRRLLDGRAAHLRRGRHHGVAGQPGPRPSGASTPTSATSWPSDPSCSSGRSRSSSAPSRRPRRWPAPSRATPSFPAAR